MGVGSLFASITRVCKWINLNLIMAFDRNQLFYMLVVYPIYLLFGFAGVIGIIVSLQLATTSILYAPFAVVVVLFIAIPLFASFYLSFCLFAAGYFGFLERIGFPFMGWARRLCQDAVEWFRAKAEH